MTPINRTQQQRMSPQPLQQTSKMKKEQNLVQRYFIDET